MINYDLYRNPNTRQILNQLFGRQRNFGLSNHGLFRSVVENIRKNPRKENIILNLNKIFRPLITAQNYNTPSLIKIYRPWHKRAYVGYPQKFNKMVLETHWVGHVIPAPDYPNEFPDHRNIPQEIYNQAVAISNTPWN
jgi:hypothetical protein